MKIAIIGIRGIPVTYSAFETCAEVLSTELVKRGHQVFVYCRSGCIPKSMKVYKGVALITLPHREKKNFTTIIHSFISTLHACLVGNYDVILYLGVGSTFFSIFPRVFGTKTIVHIDGMDWKRKKWNVIGRTYLKFSEYLTTLFPNEVVTDSQYMKQYYQKKYHQNIFYIPYGYFEHPKKSDIQKILKKYRLIKSRYFIWVGRFVPENYIEDFLFAFKQIKDTSIRCIVLGDDLYESDYKKKIYHLIKQDTRIIFRGFISHEEVLALEANSLAYIETKRSGGTHMSLVEAMGVGSLIVSHANQANKEVLGNAAIFYANAGKQSSLIYILHKIMREPHTYDELRTLIKKRVKKYYAWPSIIIQYERLFTSLVK